MIKVDVVLFAAGIAGIALGAALFDTVAGPWIFLLGCAATIGAPVLTVTGRRGW